MLTWLFRALRTVFANKVHRGLLIVTLITLASGTLVYHLVEGWRVLDSLYFCVITLATIGYGDLFPVTDFGKIFTIIYVLLGLGILSCFIAVLFNAFRANLEKRVHEQTRRDLDRRS